MSYACAGPPGTMDSICSALMELFGASLLHIGRHRQNFQSKTIYRTQNEWPRSDHATIMPASSTGRRGWLTLGEAPECTAGICPS
eukprot:3939754-Rhodomonas_salina.2